MTSKDDMMSMFTRSADVRKAAASLDSEGEVDYPGVTPPRNRPGGEAYQARKDIRQGEKTYTFAVSGGEVKTFYTIKTIAKIFGRTQVTIRSWEDKGILPKPRYRTPPPRGHYLGKEAKGRRLYTQDQVDYLLLLCERYNMLDSRKADWDGFQAAMKQYPNT